MGETSRRNGKITRFNGDVYEGGLFVMGKEEKMDGKGKLIKANGEIYEGNFYMDTMHASGCYYYTDGSFFVGKWQWGKRLKGVMIHADGTAEEWKYRNGELVSQKPLPADDPEVIKAMKKKKSSTASASKPVTKPKSAAASKTEEAKTETAAAPATKKTPTKSGASTGKKPAEKKSTAPAAPKTEYKRIEMSSGDVYEGGYANGEYHGQGTYTSRKGWVYVGAFDNGVMTDGKLTFTDSGNIFEGHFENGALHGKGKATYYVKVDGKYEYDGEYEGDWVKGKRHGKGKRVYYNGNVYDGDWVDDKRDGYGKFERYTDKWQTKHFCDLVYEGRWQDDKKHGKGVEKHYMPGVNEDVTVYEGEWVNGKREGIFVWHLFYPATGKESSKDMQYYQNGKVVIESIPYDASIKTYEDFAAAKAKLDAATEERKRKETASASPATAKESVSSVSTLDDDIVTEWEKIDGPGDLLEMWKNPQSFTVDTDDWMITHSCEYFDHYFYTPLDSNNITTCCEEGDCAGANEILAELLGIPESVLGSAITGYREKLYGPQAYRYGYSVGEVIHSAILAAVQYGCHPAGIMNIAMYMYLHFDNTDELFLDALKCYEHGWGVDGCNDEEGIASLWFRRYMYHNGDMVEDLYDVEEHNHGEYENRWYIHINAELFEQGKTMLSNGFLGLPAYMLDSTTEENDYDEDDYSISELFHEHFYTSGEYHVSEERLSDGRICTGRLTADGNPEGECVLTDSAGNEYVCKYHNGSFHGDVYFTYANGDKFTGYYCHGKKTGVGEMVWADGERRLCIYKNDKPNGIGIYFPNYGKVRPCIYVNGEDTYKKDMEKRLRKAEYHTFEDSRYEGNVKIARDGEIILHGYGTLYFDNGSIYSGLFQNDKFCEGFIYRKEVNVLMYGTYDIDEAPHGILSWYISGDTHRTSCGSPTVHNRYYFILLRE